MGALEGIVLKLVQAVGLLFCCNAAYEIRLFAVNVYGRVIHEFDPWFNYRATEYLVRNGKDAFFNWYDDQAWYPLGRPVGTTIYPGLQFTAAYMYYFVQALGWDTSLNDVCVFVPAVFGVLSTLATFGLTYEVTDNLSAAGYAAFFMCIAPAHLMRSVAGGFDNEAIAVFAMVATFYFWVKSIKTPNSWPWGIMAGIMYVYMVGAWGGFTFVLNMIGVSAGVLVLMGRFDSGLHRAYSLWYVIGTLGAIQFPVVGYQPLKSLEQLGPMGVFFWLQLLEICEMHRRKNPSMSDKKFAEFRVMVFGGALLLFLVAVMGVLPKGYFGPLSSRVRGLFIPHTRTGNPLVDSVAEHQSTRDSMYYQYFHMMCYLFPVGFSSLFHKQTAPKIFLTAYAAIALYFSRKMIRLVLMLAPPACMVGGIAVDIILTWATGQAFSWDAEEPEVKEEEEEVVKPVAKGKGKDDGKSKKPVARPTKKRASRSGMMQFALFRELKESYDENELLRKGAAYLMLMLLVSSSYNFYNHSQFMAQRISNPSIMILGRTREGQPIMIDDFREAYWWLRDNTPEDARVLSWWDYGYQINGIANRTTIADGNTWNHEHIALLGKSLVSPTGAAHQIVRHLADYVLVWSTRYGGHGGDDIAKSPHMARISGSVYKEINPEEFYMDQTGKPSDMMAKSLIYNAVTFRLDPKSIGFEEGTFEEAYTSKNRMVRIYKVLNVDEGSKAHGKEGHGYTAWLAGRPLESAYPPALQEILRGKKDFAQLEDFNRD